MIQPNHFYDLLDCLAGQFFRSKANSARCSGKEFGTQISSAAHSYFSVAIIPKDLPNEKVVLGVLSDDSAKIIRRDGYTFAIYIDVQKITKRFTNPIEFNLMSLIIITHEICHFAYYYELFLWLGDNTGIRAQNRFKYQISEKLIDTVIEEEDNTSQTNIDEHSIEELVETFEGYKKNHFTKGGSTLINYSALFLDFLLHLGYQKMLDELKKLRQKDD